MGCNKDEIVSLEPSPKKHALFIYMIADNDLDFYATGNINEMETYITENEDIGNIYVYIDRAKNRKTAHPILYQISADTIAKINSKIIKVYSENNSADEKIFKEILDEVHSLATSKNEHLRGLVLWSHGSAWLSNSSSLSSNRATAVKSFGLDQTDENGLSVHSEMNIKKLATSLKGYHFDFLLFDACFMASIEVFYELKNNFNYIIASPTEVLAQGFPYKNILGEMLSKSPNYNKICEDYVSYFQQKKGVLQSASVSVIKTNELENFAEIFKQYISENKEEVSTTNWLQYDQDNAGFLFDLGNFISFLEERKSKKELSTQFRKMVIGYYHTKQFFNKIPLENSSGISIFVPKKTNSKNEEYDFYKTLSWNNAVNMSNIIDKL